MNLDIPSKSVYFENNELYSLAIEVWRLKKKFNKIESSLKNDESKSISNSVEKIELFLKKKKIETVDFTDVPYNEGLNVDVLSIEKGDHSKTLISETIEPTVTLDGKIIRRAKVILSQ